MFGYVKFYFKLESKKQIAYALYEADFADEITKEIYNSLKKIIKKYYDEEYNDNFKISSCTEEEYNGQNNKIDSIIKYDEKGYKIERFTE